MVDWKYLLYAQYPAFLLLAILFLVSFLRVRKSSLVKSTLWVLLFAAAFACSLLFAFLGVQQKYWTLKDLFSLSVASWVGVVLVFIGIIAHIVHLVERRHNQKVLEKELEKAAKDKDDAVAQAREEAAEAARQAHEDGRKAVYQEAAEAHFSQAAETASVEAASSDLALEAGAPISLTFDAPATDDPPRFDPMTGQPLAAPPAADDPPRFDPMTGEPLSAPPENP